MSPGRITARLKARGGMRHDVELAANAEPGLVQLEVLRPARDAKSNQTLSLTPTEARELMKRLQSRADEADRLAYQRDKRAAPTGLDHVVDELARKGIR